MELEGEVKKGPTEVTLCAIPTLTPHFLERRK
jgi:hypothetical protein